MHTLAEGCQETLRLIADTFRLWWRNLLPMLTWFVAGFVGFRLSITVAIWLGHHQHQNLAVGVFSAGVLCQLVAVVGMIRTCAKSLHRWRNAAAGTDETTDPTQQHLLELLSLTLLPLVAVWSAWGFLEERIRVLAVSYTVEHGVGGDYIFQVVDGAWKNYLPAIVVLLVLRRAIEAVDDRWPSRPAKFLQVWTEAFFLLLVVVVTPQVVGMVKTWIGERTFWFAVVDWWESARDWFAGINIPIPAGLEFLWGTFWETLWPLFKNGVGEPLTWLAITAVVFGHRALSGSGLIKGTRLEGRLAGATVPVAQTRMARMTHKAPNLLLGGLREKFYPTLNAFRLLVRVGPVFLGVVCLVYSLHFVANGWAFHQLLRLTGTTERPWNLMSWELIDFVRGCVFDTLRIALLAAAFDQCLSVAAEKRAESAQDTPPPDDPATPSGATAPEPVNA